MEIIAQNVTEYIRIFYDNSSRNIITLRSFSFMQFSFMIFDFSHMNFIKVKTIFPFVPIIYCNYTLMFPAFENSFKGWVCSVANNRFRSYFTSRFSAMLEKYYFNYSADFLSVFIILSFFVK